MDYEHFLKQVAEDLRYSIPGATVEMSDVVKVQGESYQGISVRMNDSPIAASMNLRGAHERLMDGVDYHDILQSIHDQAIEAVSQGRGFDLDLVQDYEKAKERLCMEVIPIKGNEELLTGIPHTVMEDLAVIHRIDIDDHAVVTVTNNLLDIFNGDLLSRGFHILINHFTGKVEGDVAMVEGCLRQDGDHRAFQLTGVRRNAQRQIVDNFLRKLDTIVLQLLGNDGRTSFQIRNLQVGGQSPFEAVQQSRLKTRDVHRRLVGSHDNLLLQLVQLLPEINWISSMMSISTA